MCYLARVIKEIISLVKQSGKFYNIDRNINIINNNIS